MEEFRSEKVTLSSLDNKNKDGPQLTSEALYLRELTDQIKEMREEIKGLQGKLEEYSSDTHAATSKKAVSKEKSSVKDKEPSDVNTKTQENPKGEEEKEKGSVFKEIMFCLLIIVIIGGAFMLRSSMGGKPFTFAGFSAFTVLTSSMEDVIPKDSLVITKSADPNVLQIGDDITYMSGPSSTITHRIIGIQENFAGTNARGFETKGTMNPEPDKEIVPAANVVGKVIWHSKILGKIANLIKNNWPYVIFVLIVVSVLFYFLNRIDEDEEDEPPNEEDKTKKKEKKKGKKKEKQEKRE